jgi:hypothetical protein
LYLPFCRTNSGSLSNITYLPVTVNIFHIVVQYNIQE